jgi:hypothetical protein
MLPLTLFYTTSLGFTCDGSLCFLTYACQFNHTRVLVQMCEGNAACSGGGGGGEPAIFAALTI